MDYGFALVRIRYNYTLYYFKPLTTFWSFRRIFKASSVNYTSFLTILLLDNLEWKKQSHFFITRSMLYINC